MVTGADYCDTGYQRSQYVCRHLDKGGKDSSNTDQKDDDQKMILNFSYYDNKP